MLETPVWSWVGKILWRRDRLPSPVFLGFSCGSACNAGDLGLIPRLGRSPGEGKGYILGSTESAAAFRPSSCTEQGPLSSCGVRASHCIGCSCGVQALGHTGFSTCGCMGPVVPQHVESSWIRDQTHVPWTGRRILNHWTSRERPAQLLKENGKKKKKKKENELRVAGFLEENEALQRPGCCRNSEEGPRLFSYDSSSSDKNCSQPVSTTGGAQRISLHFLWDIQHLHQNLGPWQFHLFLGGSDPALMAPCKECGLHRFCAWSGSKLALRVWITLPGTEHGLSYEPVAEEGGGVITCEEFWLPGPSPPSRPHQVLTRQYLPQPEGTLKSYCHSWGLIMGCGGGPWRRQWGDGSGDLD